MPTSTGTATTLDELIDTDFKAFAVAQGWTVNDDNWPSFLALSKGTVFLNMRRRGSAVFTPTGQRNVNPSFGPNFDTNDIYLFLSSSYDGTGGTPNNRVLNQPDALVTTSGNIDDNSCNVFDMGGPFPSYTFYASGATGPQYLYAVVETRAGFYVHWWAGEVDPLSISYTPAAAVCASSKHTHWANTTNAGTRADANWDSAAHSFPFDDEEFAGSGGGTTQIYVGGAEVAGDRIRRQWLPMYQRVAAPNEALSTGGALRWATSMFVLGPNPATGATPFHSVIVAPLLNDNSGYFPVGIMPDVRICPMHGRTAGETVTLGADTWQLWPMRRDRGDDGEIPTEDRSSAFPFENTSGQYGFAYRQVA